jgi:hypothetical protein
MTIKKDENVIAGRAGPTITPVETDTSITNAKTGQTYADEKEAKADVDNPATLLQHPKILNVMLQSKLIN